MRHNQPHMCVWSHGCADAVYVIVSRLPASPLSSRCLFTYGSLLFDPVVDALLGYVPRRQNAVVSGWARFGVPGKPYPVLVATPGCAVAAIVLTGLTREDWRIVDAFENPNYELTSMAVLPTMTNVYAYTGTELMSTGVRWSVQKFFAEQGNYVARVQHWRAEFDAAEG